MWFRFILQPIAAIALGIRDGLTDADAGMPPYIWGLIFHSEGRRRDLTRAIESLWKPVIVATVLDAIAQYSMFRAIHPGLAVLVGTLVLAITYSLARAITNRVAPARKQKGSGAQRVGV